MGGIALYRRYSGIIVIFGLVVVVTVVPMWIVIVVIRGDLLILWQRVVKGRKGRLAGIILVRPVPIIADGLLEATNNRHALFRDRFGVGILVAHHDDSFTVNSQLVLQHPVSLLNFVDLADEH